MLTLLVVCDALICILVYSIIFCTFIALNLCQEDSKVQHQNPIKKHLSIAIAKSSTNMMPDRVYARLGIHF